MEYLKESGASRQHRRRQHRTALTLTTVAMLMFATFAYAAAYFQGWVGSKATPRPLASPTCQQTVRPQALTPERVTINVYNATDRGGLAAAAAKSLRTQGFKVVKVTNDPLGKSISGVGEVRRGRTGVAGATLAAARLPGAKVVRDRRTDQTVDLVLGNKFTALTVPPKVAPPKASTPVPSC